MGRAQALAGFLVAASLLAAAAAKAQPVPAEETDAQARTRVAAALTARTVAEAAPGARITVDDEGRVVLDLNAGADPEPITRLIRASHSAALWRVRNGQPVTAWLVNWAWAGAPIGVQLRKTGEFRPALDAMTAEAWLVHHAFNGGSEAGVLGMARWCRRGGSAQAAALCEGVREAAIRRMVWDRAAR